MVVEWEMEKTRQTWGMVKSNPGTDNRVDESNEGKEEAKDSSSKPSWFKK